MEKDIMISITGLQNYEGQDPDDIQLITSGKLEDTDGAITITYEETEMSGMDATTTVLKVEEDTVSITRSGQTRSHMVFREGETHLSYYDTPYGSFTIGVRTRSVSKKTTPTNGKIEIHYSMEINNALAGENSFCLRYHASNGNN